jgi:hypothetical protein
MYAERALNAAVARRSRQVARARSMRDRELRQNALVEKRKFLESKRHSRELRRRLASERNMTMSEMLAMRAASGP